MAQIFLLFLSWRSRRHDFHDTIEGMKISLLDHALNELADDIIKARGDREMIKLAIVQRLEMFKHEVSIPRSIHESPMFAKMESNYNEGAVKKMSGVLKNFILKTVRKTDFSYMHKYEICIFKVRKEP